MDKNSLLKFISKLHGHLKSAGWQTKKVAEMLTDSGYAITQRHLDRLKEKIASTGTAIAEVKSGDNGKKISDEQMDELYEWICDQNDKNEWVKRDDVRKFLLTQFQIEVTKMSVGRYLRQMGITDKVVNTRNPANKLSREQRRSIMWDWLRKMKESKYGNRMNIPPYRIKSLDVVHDGLPKETVKTLSPAGAGRPAVKLGKRKYVNSYVTIVDGTGEWNDKAICFTHNPQLNLEQKNTQHGNEIAAAIRADMKAYGIEEWRIIYEKSGKHFRGEKDFMYEKALELNKVDKSCLILHDGGNAHKRSKKSIYELAGFRDHEAYPSSVHQWLSPNDNNLHGVKAVWSAEYYKFESDRQSTLRLMQLLDSYQRTHSKRDFERNLLRAKKSTLDEIMST